MVENPQYCACLGADVAGREGDLGFSVFGVFSAVSGAI
jgi:hypothetical protein